MPITYQASNRPVLVKASWTEGGIGSTEADILWESEPTEEGAIVRLDETDEVSLYLTFTDAEEFGGAYVSVNITQADAANLFVALRDRVFAP